MKTLILYFSGTGNTKAIAYGYEKAITKAGHSVILSSIENMHEIPEHDFLIVGGPIYAGNMPDKLINWIRKKLPAHGSNKKAIVYSTSAGLLNANGVKSIGTKLIKKGYTLVDAPTFEMPRNFYIDKYDPTPEPIQKQQFENAAAAILKSVSKMDVNAVLNLRESVIMIDLLADVFRMMAKSLGKSYQITDQCIGCGKCEKDCPQQNIDYKNKLYSNKCMMCTRCIHNCPMNAIVYKGKQIEQYKVHYEIIT
jgi:ferredoxin